MILTSFEVSIPTQYSVSEQKQEIKYEIYLKITRLLILGGLTTLKSKPYIVDLILKYSLINMI